MGLNRSRQLARNGRLFVGLCTCKAGLRRWRLRAAERAYAPGAKGYEKARESSLPRRLRSIPAPRPCLRGRAPWAELLGQSAAASAAPSAAPSYAGKAGLGEVLEFGSTRVDLTHNTSLG